MLHGMGLCAGIGGIELGLKAAIGDAYRSVVYVEREAFCASILAARMADGSLDDAPIWDDVTTFDARPWRGIDIVSAGLPCPPFSLAGKRRGDKDPRHLWPHIARVIGECSPAYAFLENVPGLVSLGLRDVLADLRRMGYAVCAGIFSAAEVGAPQQRKRLFILAMADADRIKRRADRSPKRDLEWPGGLPEKRDKVNSEPAGSRAPLADAYGARQSQPQGSIKKERGWPGNGCKPVADANGQHRGQGATVSALQSAASGCRGGAFKSSVGDQINGISGWMGGWPDGWEDGVPRTCESFAGRTQQLAALGNAVVPATASLAWSVLSSQLGCMF